MKNCSLRDKASLLRLLGHPTRLAILQELSDGVKCVTDIQDLLDVPQSNVSQHLTALRREKIVDFHEDGKLRCYFIVRPKLVKSLLRFLDGEYPMVVLSSCAVRRQGRKRENAKKGIGIVA
jgi:ArsR family transcriptional regulator, arsenate/arsenite/antimonite-responsive transcriptional repressor